MRCWLYVIIIIPISLWRMEEIKISLVVLMAVAEQRNRKQHKASETFNKRGLLIKIFVAIPTDPSIVSLFYFLWLFFVWPTYIHTERRERRQKLNPLENNLCVHVNWGSIMLSSCSRSFLNMSWWISFSGKKWQCLFRISSCTSRIPFNHLMMPFCCENIFFFFLFLQARNWTISFPAYRN